MILFLRGKKTWLGQSSIQYFSCFENELVLHFCLHLTTEFSLRLLTGTSFCWPFALWPTTEFSLRLLTGTSFCWPLALWPRTEFSLRLFTGSSSYWPSAVRPTTSSTTRGTTKVGPTASQSMTSAVTRETSPTLFVPRTVTMRHLWKLSSRGRVIVKRLWR